MPVYQFFFTDPSQVIQQLNGAANGPTGSIVSGGSSTNNATTAVPFTLLPGTTVRLQPDVAVWYKFGTGAGLSVAASGGEILAANERLTTVLQANMTHLAIIPVASGSATLRVSRLDQT